MADDMVELLTYEQAVALLPEGDTVFAALDAGVALIGADWDRADVLALLKRTDCREVPGPVAQADGYGLAAWDVDYGGRHPVFFRTRKD